MPLHPYTTVPGRIKELMEKIRTVGVPERATRSWLPLIGFKSSNDRSLLNVMKFIGFVNHRGNPTDLWRQYRGPDHAVILGESLRQAYSGIFQTYEKPCSLTTSELKDYFRAETGAAEGTVSKMVDTFKGLCSIADFNRALSERTSAASLVIPISRESSLSDRAVNININIEIPFDADEAACDRIFRSLKKHLLDE